MRKHTRIRRSQKYQSMSNVVGKLLSRSDLQECSICTRHFTSDRIKAHETICQKTSGIIRKSFDISRQRIKGTEAEKFAKVVVKNEFRFHNSPWGLSTNWRGKHEDFMKKIKDVKEIANEKYPKITDLPFPPPMDYDKDYIQCQYCLRKFNSASASRHITTCASKMCSPKSKTNLREDSNPTASQMSLINK